MERLRGEGEGDVIIWGRGNALQLHAAQLRKPGFSSGFIKIFRSKNGMLLRKTQSFVALLVFRASLSPASVFVLVRPRSESIDSCADEGVSADVQSY